MDCDIHAFIQYKARPDSGYYFDFGGEISLDRDYAVFGLMSRGVRSDYPNGFEAKGLPEDMSPYSAPGVKFFNIVSETIPEDCDHSVVTPEYAYERGLTTFKLPAFSDEVFILDSDHHSHSWLTLPEMEKVFSIYSENCKSAYHIDATYIAALAAMQALSKQYCGVRLVFGFDNLKLKYGHTYRSTA